MSVDRLAAVGGVFAVLVFWHFFADWVFQSHREAMAKATDPWVRARHCLVYAVLFGPLFGLVGFHDLWALFALALLFCSHFVIDTYIPVMLWAKHLRRDPHFKDVVKPVTFTPEQAALWLSPGVIAPGGFLRLGSLATGSSGLATGEWIQEPRTYDSDVDAFKALFATPVGAILCITMDQLAHVAFLLPVAWLIVSR